MDAKFKRLENEIMQACLVDNPRVIRQDMDDRTTALEDCRRVFMTLLPWLRPQLTKCSSQGSALHIVECMTLTVAKAIEEFSRTILGDELKYRTGGATTWLAVGSTVSTL